MIDGAYRKWLRAGIAELGAGSERAAELVQEAALRVAMFGKAELYASRPRGLVNPVEAIVYLSRCLDALAPKRAVTADPKAPMTVAQASVRYLIPERTVYDLCNSGKMAHARIGSGRGRIRIRPSDFDAYLRSA